MMGTLMPTIYDVAKKAEVSIATVSAVLNRTAYVSPELSKRVKAAVQELDYTINHLAHSLQTKSTRTIGILIPGESTPDPFFGEVVRGAEDVFRKKGYLLIVGHTYNQVEEQSRYLSAFRARLVDGVLLFQAPGEDPELKRMLEKKRPVVFVGRVPAGIEADVVANDIVGGTKAGVEHLIRKGHRCIGLTTIEKSLSVSESRIEGWKRALKANRIPIDESLIIKTDMSVESSRVATRSLLERKPRPTAIFADNLLSTIGILEALQAAGLSCPKDVELVSSDDAEWLNVFRPPISTMVQPSYEMGVNAAELLLKRIRHPKRPIQKLILKPELRVR
jgi:LacI family transcriptional regulator